MFLKIGKIASAEVESVEEAVAAFTKIRDAGPDNDGYGYGSSEFADGLIYLHLKGKVDKTPLARISYNGRVWDMDGGVY